MARVKVFVDYPNFVASLRARLPMNEVRHRLLSMRSLISPGLGRVLGGPPQLRSINFYGSCAESAANDDSELNWLRMTLDSVQGHNVHVMRRGLVEQTCESGHETSRERERGVDTWIVSDLVRLAMNDLYDVAVLASNDADLVPAVEMLQSRLDRPVIHLGLIGERPLIRAACWGHVDLDIRGADDASGAGAVREGLKSARPRKRPRRHRSAQNV